MGLRYLIFIGIVTNISVEATIRHVFSRGCEESGVAEEECPPDLSGAFCLRDEEVREIAKLGILLEQHFGVPQDVEWAIDRDVELPKSIGYRLEKGNVALSPLRKRFNLSQREL